MTTEALVRLRNRLLQNVGKYDDVAMGMKRTPRRLRLAADLDRMEAELSIRKGQV